MNAAWVKKYRKGVIVVTSVVVAGIGRHFGLDSEIYLDAVGLAGAIGVILVANVGS